MSHAIHPTSTEDLTDTYGIRDLFEDGSSREIDLEPFRHPDLFAPVEIDPELRSFLQDHQAHFQNSIYRKEMDHGLCRSH